MEDCEIVALCFARDEEAIKETADKYGSYCFDIAHGILHDRSDAEECVNDTYLRTWNSIPPARPTSLKAFLGKVIRNLSIDRYRSLHAARRNRDMEVMLSELEPCLPVATEWDVGLSELLDAFLTELDPLDRKLFMGRYWHAYSVNRLAAHYGMTPNAVSLRLHRVRERLRVYLKRGGYTV